MDPKGQVIFELNLPAMELIFSADARRTNRWVENIVGDDYQWKFRQKSPLNQDEHQSSSVILTIWAKLFRQTALSSAKILSKIAPIVTEFQSKISRWVDFSV